MISQRWISKMLRGLARPQIQPQVRRLSLSENVQYEKKPSIPQSLELSYIQQPGYVPLTNDTISETLQRTVERIPDQECLVFCHSGERITYGQLINEVDQFTAGLHELGFRRGDRVGILGPSSRKWVVTKYASAKIGVIPVCLNAAYQARELEYIMNKTGMKGIVSDCTFKTQDYYEILTNFIPELFDGRPVLQSERVPSLKTVIMMGSGDFPGTVSYDDVKVSATNSLISEIQKISKKLDCHEPIIIIMTSGTTGYPKAATLTHYNVLNNVRLGGERLGYGDKHNSILCQAPLYHSFGLVLGIVSTAVFGTKLVFPTQGYDAQLSLKAMLEERTDVVYGTPTMYIDMMGLADKSKQDYSFMEKGVIGGSPCPVEVVEKMEKVFSSLKLTIGYGTTENSPITFMNYLDETTDKRTATIGQPIQYLEAKVVDSDGQTVPVNKPGELCIRGHCVMKEYWDDKEATSNVITEDGWYKTGDVATLDEEGYGRIVGRLKEMIIRGGENIFPAEIENIIHTFRKVEDVQVFGVPDKRMVEEVAAWIKIKPDETATPEEIREFCKGKLAHFKIPKHVKFVTEYPLTAVRKVQKFKMREEYSKELGLTESVQS